MTIMRTVQFMAYVAGAFICVMAPMGPAWSDDAVAIVEDTSGKVAGVEPLDLLRAGKKITLKADEGLIISYLSSCQRENIRGGEVTVGTTESRIAGGSFTRSRISCDPAALALTPEQANQSATLVFRKPPTEEGVQFVMETRQPLVIAPSLKTITVEEVRDGGTKKWSVPVVNGLADLTAGGDPLPKGALYRLTGGKETIVFRIGKEATDAPLPLLKRVVRF